MWSVSLCGVVFGCSKLCGGHDWCLGLVTCSGASLFTFLEFWTSGVVSEFGLDMS